jgi:hypothetical protein
MNPSLTGVPSGHRSGSPQRRAVIVLFSVALLIPCFWQSRIQAGDLSSHIYNCWLATLIGQGKAPRLWISAQSNNVLFDLILEWLFKRVGPGLAQRLAVSASVLVFGWGAVLFISRATRDANWWFVMPCVAMLAYGFIYHMGFFNFYLSLGVCLWYLAIVWRNNWKVRAMATPLLLLAWIAHPFPVVWALGTAIYAGAALSFEPRRRLPLVTLALFALVVARYALTRRYWYSWSINQASLVIGTNQIVLYGAKYVLLSASLLLIWLVLFRSLVRECGMADLILTLPFQLWLLNAAAVLLIPDREMFPQFGLPFGYIADRLSLMAALSACAVVAAARPGTFEKVGVALIAVLFFGFLYVDSRALNRLEDRVDVAVARLPPGQRVISSIPPWSSRLSSAQHAVDRACIGRCFSYANYEPSSRQFRVRAQPGNGIVLDNFADINAVQTGTYIVQNRDLPIYLLYECGPKGGNVCTRSLQAGEIAWEGTDRQSNDALARGRQSCAQTAGLFPLAGPH